MFSPDLAALPLRSLRSAPKKPRSCLLLPLSQLTTPLPWRHIEIGTGASEGQRSGSDLIPAAVWKEHKKIVFTGRFLPFCFSSADPKSSSVASTTETPPKRPSSCPGLVYFLTNMDHRVMLMRHISTAQMTFIVRHLAGCFTPQEIQKTAGWKIAPPVWSG